MPPSTVIKINSSQSRRNQRKEIKEMLSTTACGSDIPTATATMNTSSSSPPPLDPSTLLAFGYSKLALPLAHNHHHVLRRCISDPYSPPPPPPPTANPFLSAAGSPNKNTTSSSSSPSTAQFNSALPPLPPPPSLRRCISDINPSPAKTFSRSSSSNEMSVDDGSNTPNSKRLKRMKSRLKEMSEWCNQLMRDEEFEQDEELGSQDNPDIDATQDIPNDTSTEDSSEKEFSESVSVEKMDDSLVIHFRCHCDKAYQFLLCGGDCYYKLL